MTDKSPYHIKVGELILALTTVCSYVRVQKAESVIAKDMILIKCTTIRNNQSFTVTETLREDDLVAISDVMLVVDHIANRLRDEAKKGGR